VRNLTVDSERGRPRYGYLDPYANVSGRPEVPRVNNWTYITSDTWFHSAQVTQITRTFQLSMATILNTMGTLQGIQIRAEAYVTDFWYNNTQKGWCETRIINNTLDLSFVGTKPMVFKPGMPFQTQIAVRYADQVALDQEKLEQSTLAIKVFATLADGKSLEIPGIL